MKPSVAVCNLNSERISNVIVHRDPVLGLYAILTAPPNSLDTAVERDLIESISQKIRARNSVMDQFKENPIPENNLSVQYVLKCIVYETGQRLFLENLKPRSFAMVFVVAEYAFVINIGSSKIIHVRNGYIQLDTNTLNGGSDALSIISEKNIDVVPIPLIPEDTIMITTPEFHGVDELSLGKLPGSIESVFANFDANSIAEYFVNTATVRSEGSHVALVIHIDGDSSKNDAFRVANIHEQKDLIRTLPIFEKLRDDPVALNRILAIIVRKPIKKGQIIFKKWDIGSEFFILLSGRVSGEVEDGSQYQIKPLENSVFGEFSVFSNIPRTADAICDEDGEVLVIRKEQIFSLIYENPNNVGIKLLMSIIQAMANKLTKPPSGRFKKNKAMQLISKRLFETKAILAGLSEASLELSKFVETSKGGRDPILISGPVGSGRSFLASEICDVEDDTYRPVIALNLFHLSPREIDAALFGGLTNEIEFKKGALFEANRGDLILDGLEYIPPLTQARLADLLETNTLRPNSSVSSFPIKVRIIGIVADTVDSLLQVGRIDRKFYEFFKRRHVKIPSLHDRLADLPHMVASIMNRFRVKEFRLSERALDFIASCPWPGELNQLIKAIEKAVKFVNSEGRTEITQSDFILANRDEISPTSATKQGLLLPSQKEDITPTRYSNALLDAEKRYLEIVLQICNNNTTEAATKLGLARSTLYKKMTQFGLETNDAKDARRLRSKKLKKLRKRAPVVSGGRR